MISIRAEIVSDPRRRELGLMGRKHLSENSGMLFVFGFERPMTFWMANTYIPLQIAFIKGDGTIGQIESMVPLSTRAVNSKSRYRYALEVNDGWFDQNNIKVGDTLAVPALGIGPEGGDPAAQPPNAVVTPDYKSILETVHENPGTKVLVKWVKEDGYEMPVVTATSPIVFESTKSGDVAKIRNPAPELEISPMGKMSTEKEFISIPIGEVTGMWDVNGNPIASSDQLLGATKRKA